MGKLRLFVALELPADIRQALCSILQNVAGFHSVKWVEPGNLHLTLLFLGDQMERDLPVIAAALWQVAQLTTSFPIKLGGFDAFPSRRKPKTLFVPVQAGEGPLGNLVENLSKALQKEKITFDLKPFHGHVTLGRSKTLKGLGPLVALVSSVCAQITGEMNVEHFVLFQSRLTEKGPIYTAVEKFRLGG